jgi:predicted transcriptional regulator YdeE/DNA-binding transcriptional MerR regulator
LFKIGDFSKLAQVSVKTLRYYAQLGLLKPVWVDRFSGYRYYTLEQLPRLNRILALKDLGFSLEQIQQMLREDLAASELRGMLRLKQAELERQLLDEGMRLRRIQARLRQIDQEGRLPAYDVVLKQIASQRVAGIREVVADIYQVQSLFARLQGALGAQGSEMDVRRTPLTAPMTAPMASPLAIYYDADYREREIDVEAARPVTRSRLASDCLVIHELPAVESMACALHQGGPDGLADANRFLMTWVEENGYRIAGPSREVYLQSHPLSESVEPEVTEVQLPVQKKPVPVFITQQKEKDKMEPKIATKPAFKAVGMLYKGKNQNQEIAQMWSKFNPRMSEIKDIADGAFGLCKPSDESGVFQYLACMAVKECKEAPPGMEIWEVPEQKYVIFPCTLPTLHETYRYAFETWIPQSGYEYSRGIDFEYYDESFDPNNKDSQLFIYIPLK